LKDLFQQARIPLWDRACWPIITENGIIIWARQFGPAETSDGKVVFYLSEKKLAANESADRESPSLHVSGQSAARESS